MSLSLEQLAADLQPLAVAEYIQLPPAPKPVPAKPAAAKPAAAAAATPAPASVAAPTATDPAKPAASGVVGQPTTDPAKPAAQPAAGAATPTPRSVVAQPTTDPAKLAAGSVDGPAAKPVAATPAATPVVPPKPIRILNFSETGLNLDACITPDKVVEAAKIMERHGYAIDAVTGMDWLAQGLMEVVYDFLHFQTGMRVAIRARIPRSEPRIATISNIYQGANWHERETHDMFGIVFVGHPDLTPFLLPDDADFHPLRKDYNP